MVSKIGKYCLIFLMSSPAMGNETSEISAICDATSAAAATERGVPQDVL